MDIRCPKCKAKATIRHCGGNDKCPWFVCYKCVTPQGYTIFNSVNSFVKENS